MYIQLDDIKLNYIEEGIDSKTNIVLLHGWGANIESFRPIIDNLSNKFKVYAIDLPGYYILLKN